MLTARLNPIVSLMSCALLLLVYQSKAPSADPPAEPTLRLVNDCPAEVDNCVEMLLHTGERAPGAIDPVRAIGRDDMDETGHAEFVLFAMGRLNGSEAARYRFIFRSYVDGIECTEFGDGHVAALGFSGAGHPLVLTDEGLLELVDGTLEIGCAGCVTLIGRDSGRVVRKLASPAWDFTSVGLYGGADLHLFFDEEARVFLKRQGRCVEIADDRPFRRVEDARCASPLRIVGHYGFLEKGIRPMRLAPGEFLLESDDAPGYYMHLLDGACT